MSLEIRPFVPEETTKTAPARGCTPVSRVSGRRSRKRPGLRAVRRAAALDADLDARIAALRAACHIGDVGAGNPTWYTSQAVERTGQQWRSMLDYIRHEADVSPSSVTRDQQRVPGQRSKRLRFRR